MGRQSLSIQMLVSLVCWATLILVVYAGVNVWVYRSRALTELKDELTLESRQLQTAVTGALWHFDTGQIDKVLDGVMRNKTIAGVVVTSGGREFARRRIPGWSAAVGRPDLEDTDEFISTKHSLRYRGEHLGDVTLWATTREVNRQIFGAVIYFAGTILLLDLILVVGLYTMMSRVVISPLRKLAAYALSAGPGDNRPPEPPEPFTGEMEVLRQSMARMLEELEQRWDEVQNEVRRFKNSEERFRILVNTIPDYIWLKNPDGVFLSCNKMFCRLFASSEEEIIGSTDYEFVAEELADQFRERDRRVMETGEVAHFQESLPQANGEQMTLDTIKAPMFDTEGNLMGVLGIARDITTRLKSEEDQVKLREQLNQTQKIESIGRLAGGVAHDFNNMLGVIRGNAELALAEADMSAPLAEYIHEITHAADRSADLTRQLLAFARKEEVSPRQINLNEAMDGMLKMLRRLIGADIELTWTPGEGLWTVKMDPSQLDHILVNLCINARDAISGEGRISIETRNITLDASFCESHPDARAGEFVMLAVGDNGEGIARQFISSIFDPFFTTKQSGKGTGLGLSTVYGVIRQNDGFITVYSEPGLGTVFHIYLPRNEGGDLTAVERTGGPSARGGSETVLLVEDEASILMMITKTLEKQGYTVLATDSPVEAVKIAATVNRRIDLLLTDVIMPKINGRDLAAIIRRDRLGMRVLFMSGYTADVIQEKDMAEIDAGFIQKPFSNADLLERVRQVLESV